MRSRLVIGLGELVWDVFPDGRRLGGAPANFAYHAAALGDRGAVATAVGADAAGREAIEFLQARGLDVTAVQTHPTAPTGRVTVNLVGGQPEYRIEPAGAWREPTWTAGWEALFARADALCYGTLLCSSTAGRQVLARAVAAAPGALRVADLNLRPPFDSPEALDCALGHAQVIKLNAAEEGVLALRLGVRSPGERLLAATGVRAVAITRGERGAMLLTSAGILDVPADRSHYASTGDPVGAGDAFTAALVHHFLRGSPAAVALAAANRYAGYIAYRPGAMPDVPTSIRDSVVAARDAAPPPG